MTLTLRAMRAITLRPVVVIGCALVLCAGNARAQSGWEVRLSAAPNPMPAGACAGINVELVDDHGYRRATLSNGAAINPRSFVYASSDTSHFALRKEPAWLGYVCADSTSPAATGTITVTLPDGLRGTLAMTIVPKGGVRGRAVVYRPQAPMRLASSPEYAPGFVAGQTEQAASMATAATGAPTGSTTVAPNAPSVPSSAASSPGSMVAKALPDTSGIGLGAAVGTSPLKQRAMPSGVTTKKPSSQPTIGPTIYTTATLALSGTHLWPISITTDTTTVLSLSGTHLWPIFITIDTTTVLSLTGTHTP